MNKEFMKLWMPIVIPSITSLMVLALSVNMQDERDNAKKLLQEVKEIKKGINDAAVSFGKIEITIDNLDRRITKIEAKIDN